MKLDAQAKELAEFQKQAAVSAKSGGKMSARQPLPPRGTRLSKRLRGAIEEEEWQSVPDDWLDENKSSPVLPKTGLESDAESDLTSLSGEDEDRPEPPRSKQSADGKLDGDENDAEMLDNRGITIAQDMSADFIEWETVSIIYFC